MKNGLYFDKFTFINFFSNFLDSHPKITQNQLFQQQIWVLLAQISPLNQKA